MSKIILEFLNKEFNITTTMMDIYSMPSKAKLEDFNGDIIDAFYEEFPEADVLEESIETFSIAEIKALDEKLVDGIQNLLKTLEKEFKDSGNKLNIDDDNYDYGTDETFGDSNQYDNDYDDFNF